MKLIVGLGNPGSSYDNTRHNVGFQIIDLFASKNQVSISKEKFRGLYGELTIRGEKVILLKPQSYMNLSGEVVRQYVDFFKISISDVLILSDDLDLPLGSFRIKKKGSSGGHNGLKNIEQHLGTQEYCRIKVGISNNKNLDTKDYVLGKFSKEEKKIFDEVKETVMKVLFDYFVLSFDNLMNQYNIKQKQGEESPDVR